MQCYDFSSNGSTTAEAITWSALAGETWYIVVDGFLGSVGWWTITLSCP
jgi:hypothetical protein